MKTEVCTPPDPAADPAETPVEGRRWPPWTPPPAPRPACWTIRRGWPPFPTAPPGAINAAGDAGNLWRNWELHFNRGTAKERYARQLDFFGIELAVVMPENKLLYVGKFTQKKPQTRLGPADQERRCYLTWREGDLSRADAELLSRAGISSEDRVVLKILPPKVEAALAVLEKAAAGDDLDSVRRTRFGIRAAGDGYEFYVLEQLRKEHAHSVSDQQQPPAGEPTAAAFLDAVQKKGLVSAAALATLRKQVAESKTPIPARRVAKLLVDKQVLTPALPSACCARAARTSRPRRKAAPCPARRRSWTRNFRRCPLGCRRWAAVRSTL